MSSMGLIQWATMPGTPLPGETPCDRGECSCRIVRWRHPVSCCRPAGTIVEHRSCRHPIVCAHGLLLEDMVQGPRWDERTLFRLFSETTTRALVAHSDTRRPTLARQIGIPYKRARYLVSKWLKKGWVDCVSWRYAWLTEDGATRASEMFVAGHPIRRRP